MKTFILVRHGTTDWVDQHILHGSTDIPLNARGLAQSQAAALALKDVPASHLYSSPLTRCMQTAQVVGEQVGLAPVPMDGLKELDFGWLEGKPFRDATSQKISFLQSLTSRYLHQLIRWVSGESADSLRRRVFSAFQRIVEETQEGEVTVVVGHSAVFNNILIRYFGKKFPKGSHYYSLRPCSISEFEMDGAGFTRLVRLDDAAHLSGLSDGD